MTVRAEIDRLLHSLAAPARADTGENTVQVDIWQQPGGYYAGCVKYLRERVAAGGVWASFSCAGLKSRAAVEVHLRDALKRMAGGAA